MAHLCLRHLAGAFKQINLTQDTIEFFCSLGHKLDGAEIWTHDLMNL